MNSFSLCHFSPLTTPDAFPGHKIRSLIKDKNTSDTESVASVLTKDIRKIAKSVSKKMNCPESQSDDHLDGSDGEEIFLTQSFPKRKSPKKKKSKRKHKASVVSLTQTLTAQSETLLEEDRDSEDDLFLSQPRIKTESPINACKKQKTHQCYSEKAPDSRKAVVRTYDSSDVPTDTESESEPAPHSAVTHTSHVESSQTVVPGLPHGNGHDSSDVTSDTSDDQSDSSSGTGKTSPNRSVKLKSEVPAVQNSLTVSPDKHNKYIETDAKTTVTKTTVISERDDSDTSAVIQFDNLATKPNNNKKRKKSEVGAQSTDSDEDSSDSAVSAVSAIRVRLHLVKKKKQKQSKKAGIANDLRQTKMTEHCPVTPERVRRAAREKQHRPLRYPVPSGFELAANTTGRYTSHEELRGKQLWLIKAPLGFDVSSLDGKKLSMQGGQVTHVQDKSDKQYEVTAMASQEAMYSSVVLEGCDRFVIGPAVSGQLHVMDWIPSLMPVKLNPNPPATHTIPDNLQPRYKPFGSASPTRITAETEEHAEGKPQVSEDTQRRKKKRKKEKKRKRENDLNV